MALAEVARLLVTGVASLAIACARTQQASVALATAQGFRGCGGHCEIASYDIGPDAFDPKEIAQANARLERVERELAGIEHHAWAGVYRCGTALGKNVTIHAAPKNGFVFTWHGCEGLYGFNYGDIEEIGPCRLRGKLARTIPSPKLAPTALAAGGFGDAYVDGEFFSFDWAGDRYLVPRREMIPLCCALNEGDRRAFEQRGPFGGFPRFALGPPPADSPSVPPIPEEFRPYLLERPVRARITSVESDRLSRAITEYVLRIDAGSEQGLRVGMRVFPPSEKAIGSGVDVPPFLVESLREHEATVRFSLIATPAVPEPRAPTIGLVLSTRRDDEP